MTNQHRSRGLVGLLLLALPGAVLVSACQMQHETQTSAGALSRIEQQALTAPEAPALRVVQSSFPIIWRRYLEDWAAAEKQGADPMSARTKAWANLNENMKPYAPAVIIASTDDLQALLQARYELSLRLQQADLTRCAEYARGQSFSGSVPDSAAAAWVQEYVAYYKVLASGKEHPVMRPKPSPVEVERMEAAILGRAPVRVEDLSNPVAVCERGVRLNADLKQLPPELGAVALSRLLAMDLPPPPNTPQ